MAYNLRIKSGQLIHRKIETTIKGKIEITMKADMIENFDSPFKVCHHCGKNKINLVQYNYAGFFDKVNLADFYCFPNRIKIPSIPGPQKSIFICDKCASSNYKVHCKAHGTLMEGYDYGRPPRCFACEADLKNIKNGELPNSFEAMVPLFNPLKEKQDKWFCLSEDDEVYFVQNKSILSDKKEYFTYSVEFINGYIVPERKPIKAYITKSYI